jgi:hypothetical protein
MPEVSAQESVNKSSNGRKNLITLKDQTNKMYQSSREICLQKSGVRYA